MRGEPPMNTAVTAVRPVVPFRFRILVVDDEPSIRETAGMILENEGYDVRTAVDGVDGLRALSEYLPDLIISDMNMPRMSGSEFLSVVRKRFPQIATIAVSGEPFEGEMLSGLAADAFLQKGRYTCKDLLQEIVNLLSSSGAC
jgi:CheY-like chemotaxis protein